MSALTCPPKHERGTNLFTVIPEKLPHFSHLLRRMRKIFNSKSVRSLHRNDPQDEANVNYRYKIFNLACEATVSGTEATPFAFTVLIVC